MSDIKYLCIDDQQDNSVDLLLDALGKPGEIIFERNTPVEVGSQVSAIIDMANDMLGRFGLIVDLRLDMESNKEGVRVPYRGPTLAQELRTRMAEGQHSFPIVLWSIANKLETSFNGDDSSHDLFDAVYGKDDRIQTDSSSVGRELGSLVRGYEIIQSPGRVNKSIEILSLDLEDGSPVYSPFVEELSLALKSSAPHKGARLILDKLIKMPGLLATEALIALRLGVDVDASGSSWGSCKKHFVNAQYAGPFHEGWPRWWWYKVEDWWASLSQKQPNLRRVTAAERVSILNETLSISLIPAKPIVESYQTRFFTQCVATGLPLDPTDGLRVVQMERKPWHDTGYVSMHAALNRINKNKWRIDLMDRGRFDSAIKGG